jgi:NitT/TauT family transport system permease protein
MKTRPRLDVLRRAIRQTSLPALFALSSILLWSLATRFVSIPQYLIPAPVAIWRSMFDTRGYYLSNVLVTLMEAFTGFGLAVLIGFVAGTLFAVFGWLEEMLLPYAIASQAIPVVAVAPLLVLWLGSGVASKVAMAALLCFFPMVVNTTKGLRAVGPEQLALFRVYNASRLQVFWKLRLPSSLPFVASGMRISAALSMIGAIVAEYAGADRGIGYVIMQATYRIDTVQLFAAIFYSALGGMLIFLFAVTLERVFMRRFLS